MYFLATTSATSTRYGNYGFPGYIVIAPVVVTFAVAAVGVVVVVVNEIVKC